LSYPGRGDIVRIEKLEASMFRIVNRDGEPTLVGLFNSVDNAVRYAKERGWRPESASIATAPKKAKAKRILPRTDELDFA